MKIYSMTATFGKLEHETLTLQPGLNVIHAPNEWGKSTWCAFLIAMLYGIETRVHTTRSAIADKERYAPWSGSPMAGRIDLCWNGRDITIERSSKGRSVFGVFRAYETESGLDVPELTAVNCGQVLLGVEKSVFTRSGFLRLTDLPVTQDETLRRRLNAIVTTGDESGTADTLAQKLRDLKNRCRLNKSNGLLPQAEAQRQELQGKLSELQELQAQSGRIKERLGQLEQHHKALLNHQTALQYAENQTYHENLAFAEAALASAADRESSLKTLCQAYPPTDEVDRTLLRLRQLRDSKDALSMELGMLPSAPQKPETPAVFQGIEPETAISQAELSEKVYEQDSRKKPFPWYCILLLLLGGACLLLLPRGLWRLLALLPMAAAGILLRIYAVDKHRRENTVRALRYQYQPIPPEQWVQAAHRYAEAQKAYEESSKQYQAQLEELEARMNSLQQQQIAAVTGSLTLPECEQFYTTAQNDLTQLAAAVRERQRCEALVQALRSAHKESPAPEFTDTMEHTQSETARLISDCAYEQRQLQVKLGHSQGRMEALGSETVLRQQLDGVTERISQLEAAYSALEIAQSTLSRASAELQRRFAPRISKRAQELFGKLTDGRYTRLTLGEDLTVHAAAADEATLHSALWRSEGTVDQLYLALRLAVAEELTPEAPLVLDDALVRFDDKRLAEALDVLTEEAESKQVILFTCQQRESGLLNH